MGPIEEATTGAIGIVQQIASVFDKANMYAGRKSLIDVTKEARVEPLLIVDSALMGYEHMYDISQTMQAVFAGYYLQAVEMMHSINDIEISKKLAPLNPNRSPNATLLGYQTSLKKTMVNDWRMNPVSYQYSLPTKASKGSLSLESYHSNDAGVPWYIAMEADKTPVMTYYKGSDGEQWVDIEYTDDKGNTASDSMPVKDYLQQSGLPYDDKAVEEEVKKSKKAGKGDEEDIKSLRERLDKLKLKNSKLEEKMGEGPMSSVKVEKDVTKMITDVSPLSVGKLYDVTFKEGKEVASVKVAIRLMAKMVPTSTILHICTIDAPGKKDIVERFHGVRSGELEFVNHFVFCNDLIDAHRKAAITDKTGLYKEILNRRNRGILAGILERNPSVAVASNLAIIDSNTLENIEGEMGGAFKSNRVRDAVFDTTSLMILAVVDRGYDRVRFYHRGIDGSTDMSMREIKSTAKDSGGQIKDIMNAFLNGSAPKL